jgi:hypothetical protein
MRGRFTRFDTQHAIVRWNRPAALHMRLLCRDGSAESSSMQCQRRKRGVLQTYDTSSYKSNQCSGSAAVSPDELMRTRVGTAEHMLTNDIIQLLLSCSNGVKLDTSNTCAAGKWSVLCVYSHNNTYCVSDMHEFNSQNHPVSFVKLKYRTQLLACLHSANGREFSHGP